MGKLIFYKVLNVLSLFCMKDLLVLNFVLMLLLLYLSDSVVVFLNLNYFKKNLMYIEIVLMCNVIRLVL